MKTEPETTDSVEQHNASQSFSEWLDQRDARDAERGLESNPYTYEEYEARRNELNGDF